MIRRILAFVGIAVMLGAIGTILLLVGALTRTLPAFIAGVVILVVLILWAPRCFRTVGSAKAQARAVLVRFGQPIDVLEAGLQVILWPIDQLVVYPTKQYLLTFGFGKVHSKREEIETSSGKVEIYETALMEVEANLYFAWAKGRSLLTNFERLPTPTGNFEDDTSMLTAFFEPTVSDGLRAVMARRNHKYNREEKDKIENEIKNHLYGQAGNPFLEGDVPRDQVDVIIREIGFTEEMEGAFSAPEVGRRRGEEAAAEMSRALIATGEAYRRLGILGRIFAPFLAKERR